MTENNVHSTLFFNYLKRTRYLLSLSGFMLFIHLSLLLIFPDSRYIITGVILLIAVLIMIIYTAQICGKNRSFSRTAWFFFTVYGLLSLSAILVKLYNNIFFELEKETFFYSGLIAAGQAAFVIGLIFLSQSKESAFKFRRELNLIGLIITTIVVIYYIVSYRGQPEKNEMESFAASTLIAVAKLSPFIIGAGIYWISIWKKDLKRRTVYLILIISSFISFILYNFNFADKLFSGPVMSAVFNDIPLTAVFLLAGFAAWNEINIREQFQATPAYNLFYVSRIERITPVLSVMTMLLVLYFNIQKLDGFLIMSLMIFMIPYNIFFLLFELYSYRSEDAVLSLLSVSPIGVHITDRKFRKTYFINKSMYDIFKSTDISPDIIMGNNLPEILKNKILNTISGNKIIDKMEMILKRPDGTKFNAECKIIPGRYFSYNIVIAWVWDITNRKKYEGAILQQKYSAEIASLYKSELMDNLSNRIQSGYVTLKYENNGWPDFILTGTNKRILELFNFKEEVKNKRLRQIFPDPEPGLIRRFFEVMCTGVSLKRELRFIEINKIFQFLIFRVSDDEIACLIDDITESKNKEKELIERERELSTLLGNLPGMAYRCKKNMLWSMFFVSRGSLDLSGYRPDELAENGGVSWNDLIHPDDRERVWNEIQQELAIKQSYYVTYRIIPKDSSIKYVWEKGVGVYDEKDNIIFLEGFIFDITKQKEAEQVLHEHVMRESEIDKARALRQMAGGIAHDLNNRLMGIGSYTSLIDLKVKDDNIKKYTERIQSSILESTQLIEDLLIFARKSDIVSGTFSVHTMLRETVLTLPDDFPEDITIKSELKAENDVIKGDHKQINKAIYDMISNAKDAMPDGGNIIISTENKTIDNISLSDLTGGDAGKMFIIIKISDNGLGIEKDNLKRIFDPFYTTKPVGKGKGLGLSAVYGTIQAHKGAVTVESFQGKGTTFSIYLPVVESV